MKAHAACARRHVPKTSALQTKQMALAGTVWAAAQVNWLLWAYTLEFGGASTFLAVQLSSLAFFFAHVWACVCLMQGATPAWAITGHSRHKPKSIR